MAKRKTNRADRADVFVQGYLQAVAMDEYSAYMERGRAFRDLPPDQLDAEYVKAGNAYLGEDDQSKVVRFNDLTAEYKARQQEPPTGLIKGALKKAQTRIAKMFGEGDLEHVKSRLKAFMDKMDEPKN